MRGLPLAASKVRLYSLVLGSLIALGPLTTQPTAAQSSLEGEWTAHFLTPGGEIASTTYRVIRAGDEHFAAMEFGGQRFTFVDYQLEADTLTFTMDVGFVMDCRLAQQATRQFKGSCLDLKGNVGPAVIGPPGVLVEPADLDLDKAFDVWGMSREEYERRLAEARGAHRPPEIEEPPTLPSRIVEVNGSRRNIVQAGEGKVTVVLESGAGDDHKVWSGLQEKLAERTRTLSYDRAGLGASDPSTLSGQRTPEVLARELHEMLEAAGVAPPYILVGHEAGALTVQQFHALYPDEVTGLVLIEPSHAKEEAMWSELDYASREEYLSRKRTLLSMFSEPAAREFDAYLSAVRDNHRPVEEVPPGVPLYVVTGLRALENPKWFGETEEGIRAKSERYREFASELGGVYVPALNSGSYVHMEDPDTVVETVFKILDGIEE